MLVDLFELTRRLIDIPSLTGDEAELSHFLAAYLRSLDYEVELQPVAGERSNLLATTGSRPRIVFSTHLDTVPPHIVSSEDAENIYGRGACDAKGIIAAQIFAAARLRAEGFAEVGLLFTVDEELASAGAVVANEHALANECHYLINGEPTDNLLATGTKGSLRFTLTTEGRAAHSAYPEHGESAIAKLLDVLAAVRRCDWPRDEFFGETTCNIGVMARWDSLWRPRRVTPAMRLAEIAAALSGTGAYLLSDEIYRDIYYTDERPESASSFYDRTIVISGLSKSMSMTGWRLGWICGDQAVIQSALVLHGYVTTCAATVSQKAALAAWSPEAEVARTSIRQTFHRRRDYLGELISRELGLTAIVPDGAFYTMVNISKYGLSLLIAETLLEHGVITVPGAAFGSEGEGFLRISFCADAPKLAEGVARIKKALQTHAGRAGR